MHLCTVYPTVCGSRLKLKFNEESDFSFESSTLFFSFFCEMIIIIIIIIICNGVTVVLLFPIEFLFLSIHPSTIETAYTWITHTHTRTQNEDKTHKQIIWKLFEHLFLLFYTFLSWYSFVLLIRYCFDLFNGMHKIYSIKSSTENWFGWDCT